MHWIRILASLQQQKIPTIMVTVVSISGSTPREVGAKMIVTEQQLFGTIGGGNLEYQATAIARQQLQISQPQQLRRFPLGAGLGQCCGGIVHLLFEPIVEATLWITQAQTLQHENQNWLRAVSIDHQQDCFVITENNIKSLSSQYQLSAALIQAIDTLLIDQQQSNQRQAGYYLETLKATDFKLLVFGAGHVGQAIISIMAEMPVSIKWIDTRADIFPSDFSDNSHLSSNIETICTDTPEAEVDDALAGSFFLVMTHDHGLDQKLSEQILKRGDFAYFGLIGSKTKRRMFEKRMTRRGITPDQLNGMICPIGIDGIASKQPAAIAISVSAQIMQSYGKINQQQQSFGSAI